MRRGLLQILLLLCLSLLAMPTEASVRSIWAVNDGEKVERDDLNNENKRSNSVWDGEKIKVFGARNEIIAFQVIVEADQPIDQLTLGLSELRLIGGSTVIKYQKPNSDPTDYVGRPIQIFSVNYMNVVMPSNAEWVYKVGSRSAPKDPTGWKPVQLVPENAHNGRGGFPLRVEGKQNQAIWIEIYTHRDLPAGIYRGNVEVTADGQKRSIPLELELFDFTLPDKTVWTRWFITNLSSLSYIKVEILMRSIIDSPTGSASSSCTAMTSQVRLPQRAVSLDVTSARLPATKVLVRTLVIGLFRAPSMDQEKTLMTAPRRGVWQTSG